MSSRVMVVAALFACLLPARAVADEPPTQQNAVQAVLEVFPDGYWELAEVTYGTMKPGAFYLDSVTFLMPEKAWDPAVSAADRKAQACASKKKLQLECACERVETGPAKDYAWSPWPDKRVVPVTVFFAPGC